MTSIVTNIHDKSKKNYMFEALVVKHGDATKQYPYLMIFTLNLKLTFVYKTDI